MWKRNKKRKRDKNLIFFLVDKIKSIIIASRNFKVEMSRIVGKPASSSQAVKRAVVSYENMSQELQNAFKEKYPRGYADYMGDIFKVDKPNGTSFYAVSVEMPGAIYLVKISVKVDDYEDVEKDLFNDDMGDEGTGDGTFPEDGTDSSAFTEDDDSKED